MIEDLSGKNLLANKKSSINDRFSISLYLLTNRFRLHLVGDSWSGGERRRTQPYMIRQRYGLLMLANHMLSSIGGESSLLEGEDEYTLNLCPYEYTSD